LMELQFIPSAELFDCKFDHYTEVWVNGLPLIF